jgi:hypothetical protein
LKANPKFEEVIDAWIDDPRYYGKWWDGRCNGSKKYES